MSYQLPEYVLKDKISFNGRFTASPSVQIPLSERISEDRTLALAEILCEITHVNTGYPYKSESKLGDHEVDHGFRVSVAGRINPFIHLPAYQVNAMRTHPDSIEGAEGLVVIVSDQCPHSARSLEFILPILKGTVAHTNVL